MKIVIGNDHAAVEYKRKIVEHLENAGIDVENVGCDDNTSVDYPDYAGKVAKKIQNKEADLGILICGTGIGMSIAANKFKGIRASLCSDCYSAKMTRMHNDSNILCLGARVLGIDLAMMIVDTYISTGFEGGRHIRRLDKIKEIEDQQ